MPPAKIKYLTNKDLLEEIHASKNSYCEYLDPKYSNYDIVVNDLSKITQELLDETRKRKVIQETIRRKREMIAKGIKNPVIEFTLDDVPEDSIVIRLMTFDHIPINEEKLCKAKTESERHIKCNFPPFQHYIICDSEFKCVGKSHWQYGLENGQFNVTHGKMTNKLAMMFMKLVERYGHRGNWRGYCITENDQALTQRGWLSINEINENDIILSCDNSQLKWSKIKSIYRGHYNGLMHQIISENIDALVTPGHKMVTERGLVKTELLTASDNIIILGTSEKSSQSLLDDDIIKVIGIIIDGLIIDHNEFVLDIDLIIKLSATLRELLIHAMVGNDKTYTHADKVNLDLFRILCTLSGITTSIDGNTVTLTQNIPYNNCNYNGNNKPTVHYDGMVWCPETEYGCFVVKRNEKIYLTGNTYLDEMKSQALVQLSQIGLQFDESKSTNPFSYFSSVLTNSFTRILNIEKKNQNIRDDLLTMHGATPSYTRTVNNEIASKKLAAEIAAQKSKRD